MEMGYEDAKNCTKYQSYEKTTAAIFGRAELIQRCIKHYYSDGSDTKSIRSAKDNIRERLIIEDK